LFRFETSAKENVNIDKACRFLVSHILENDLRATKEEDKDNIKLDSNQQTNKSNDCAC